MLDRKIKRVAIIGGTHGNEFTGVYLIKKWLKDTALLQRETIEVEVIHANERATDEVRRYINQDLNRSFLLKDLSEEPQNYEQKRAQELNKILGPKESEEKNFDFIIDLHSTTSNMGFSFILDNEDEFTYAIAEYLKRSTENVYIFRDMVSKEDAPYITSVIDYGIVIEVGPVPQGVVRADMLLATEKFVYDILDFIDTNNKGAFEYQDKEIEVYKRESILDFPRDDNNEISAMIHQDIQDRDYHKINEGDIIFTDFDGNNIIHHGDSVYPIFVNEAAYYEKGIAMIMTKKEKIIKKCVK